MNTSLPTRFSVNCLASPAGNSADTEPPGSPSLMGWLVNRFGRRRWRHAAPYLNLNDHLRRDIGLPPLDRSPHRRCSGWADCS